MCVRRETNALDCITVHMSMLSSYYHVFVTSPAYTIGQLTHLEFSHLTLSPRCSAISEVNKMGISQHPYILFPLLVGDPSDTDAEPICVYFRYTSRKG